MITVTSRELCLSSKMATKWKFLPSKTIALGIHKLGKKVHGHGDCSTVGLWVFISDVGLETRRKIDWMFDKSCPFASGHL